MTVGVFVCALWALGFCFPVRAGQSVGTALDDLAAELRKDAKVTAHVEPVQTNLEQYLNAKLNYRVPGCRHELLRDPAAVDAKLQEIHPDLVRTLQNWWPAELVRIRTKAMRIPAKRQAISCQFFKVAIVTDANRAVVIEVDNYVRVEAAPNPWFD
jgi:hypothetical protein